MNNRILFRFTSIGILIGIIASGLFFFCVKNLSNSLINTYEISTFSTQSPITTSIDIQYPKALYDGKVNINYASSSELMLLNGIGESKAKAIIEFREKYGFYTDISELTYVPGIGIALLESIQDKITIGNN